MDLPKSARNRGRWTSAAVAYVERVVETLDRLKDYWPLTLRQAYYQLVAAGFIDNNRGEYQKLSRILAHARIDGLIAWEAIEDRTRTVLLQRQWRDVRSYIEWDADLFLRCYRRDLLQSQPVALEVWVEKDALSRICQQAAERYGVPVIVARGFSSVSYVNECRRRVEANAGRGQPTRILYFGDLDPSGWEMLPAMLTTLQQEMELREQVDGERCALTPEQVRLLHLPHNPDALKETDSRAAKHVKRFGRLAVELDALPPATLMALVQSSIEQNLDLSKLENERTREATESEELRTKRRVALEHLGVAL